MYSYNSAVGSLESRVMVSARKFRQLGAADGDEQPPVNIAEPVTRSLRLRGAPELSAGSGDRGRLGQGDA